MLNTEFENEFDILYNNIMSNQAPGIDVYEKSVFLTKAKEQLILSYYNGKNTYLESFEKTEEMRRYLSNIVKTAKLSPLQETPGNITLTENSEVFKLPGNLWFITYEAAKLDTNQGDCIDSKTIQVVPVTQDDLYRTLENPFKGAGLRRALRLDIGNNQVELISKYKIANYIVRYLEYISPIILTDLDEGLSINGISEETECDLPEGLHRVVLELAVQLASNAYKANN